MNENSALDPSVAKTIEIRAKSDWPALAGWRSADLVCQRGVWGKAHRASSDFRWLARTAGFGRGEFGLGRQLNLGLEDQPVVFPCWRVVDNVCYAVAAYPSRAEDAAGRRGFLEKQVFEWSPPTGHPTAIGAFFLLAQVARLDDTVWWSRQDEAAWAEPDFSLQIAGPEPCTRVSPERLQEQIEKGLRELRDLGIGERSLAELYSGVLDECRPALLRGLEAPLPPCALAALLLPLKRRVADQLSVTGWVPGSRADLRELGRRWDVMVSPPHVRTGDVETRVSPEARQLARAVLAGDPQLLGKASFTRSVGSPEPSEDSVDRQEATVKGEPGPCEVEPHQKLFEDPPARVDPFREVDPDARSGSIHPARPPITSSSPNGEPLHEVEAEQDPWEAWTAAMRHDLEHTTEQLIEQGLWAEWRQRARLHPRERLTTAMAWLCAGVWSRTTDVPVPTFDVWEEVLDDVGTLPRARLKRLCTGPEGRHTWPWIPTHEKEQLQDLSQMVIGQEDLALLARSIEDEARRWLVEVLEGRQEVEVFLSPESSKKDTVVSLQETKLDFRVGQRKWIWFLLALALFAGSMLLCQHLIE